MADGFASATRSPVLVNQLTSAGTGNGMCNIMTAFQNKMPLIITAAYTTDAVDTSVSGAAQTHEKYERLIAQAKGIPAIPTAVVWPCRPVHTDGPCMDGARGAGGI